jgi:hypothetical protein
VVGADVTGTVVEGLSPAVVLVPDWALVPEPPDLHAGRRTAPAARRARASRRLRMRPICWSSSSCMRWSMAVIFGSDPVKSLGDD